VESLVALVILGMSAASTGGFLQHQMRQSASNQLASEAYAIAAEHLEDFRAQSYASMAGSSSLSNVGGVDYTVATTVAPDMPAANMKLITVSVSWNEPAGPKNVSMSTVYTSVRRN
jgi:type II secretory pathway pseudopilin PulG